MPPPSQSAAIDPPAENAPPDRAATGVAVLGATGSIGTATLQVIGHLHRVDPDRSWHLTAAACHSSVDDLGRLCDGIAPVRTVRCVAGKIGCRGRDNESHRWVGDGPDALSAIATDDEVDIVVAAIVGSAGLESTLAAAQAGKRVALANKEALVVAGPLMRQTVRRTGAELLPIDSEHSAIWQALGGVDQSPDRAARRAEKLILTASGGPFLHATGDQMRDATPAQAMNHPTWKMGPKITVDSATMMNKALEIIEARWLFDVPADRIDVMVHPQSIIHSMVRTRDGSVIAQMSPPDMRLPIQLALTHPRRLPGIAPTIDTTETYEMTLLPVDRDRFPAIDLGFEVARSGGTAGSVLNAANERAVELFLAGQIRLTDIVEVAGRVLRAHDHDTHPTLEQLLNLDRWARRQASAAAGIKHP